MNFSKKKIPEFIKPLIRFVYYWQERRKFFREIKIKKWQDRTILKYNQSTKKLILFLVEGVDYKTGIDKISGGIISIVSLHEESRKLKDVHKSEVILSTLPNHHLLTHFSQFENTSDVFRFDQLKSCFTQVEEVLIHLPEYVCEYFLFLMSQKSVRQWCESISRVHLNIMNQNIRLMPSEITVNELKSYVTKITITTAHLKYCTPQLREKYQVPVHLLSVWISPEKYVLRKYSEKENLVVISPDYDPVKETVVKKLQKIPNLNIQVIKDLTYENYKQLIAKAKWSITFGEGFDGYFIESIFSGAISFAIYNKDFFPDDFANVSSVYHSADLMIDEIANDLDHFDDPLTYKHYQTKLYALCSKYYSHERYVQLLTDFYKGSYTYA